MRCPMAGKTPPAPKASAPYVLFFRIPDELPVPRVADVVPEGEWPPVDSAPCDDAEGAAAAGDLPAALAARLRNLV